MGARRTARVLRRLARTKYILLLNICLNASAATGRWTRRYSSQYQGAAFDEISLV